MSDSKGIDNDVPLPKHMDVANMKSVYAHYSVGDPEWDELAKKLPPSPRGSVLEQRTMSAHFGKIKLQKFPGPDKGLIVEEKLIPANDVEILIRTYVPQSSEGQEADVKFPLLIWFHGGGFCVGNLDNSDDTCRSVCVDKRVTVVNVDYRLAPEFPFPHGVMDSYDAVKWAASNAAQLKADPKLGFILAGSSAGANFVAAITLLARDDDFFKTYPITGQVLVVPTTCAQEVYPQKHGNELQSRWDIIDAPMIDSDAIEKYRIAYIPPTGPTPFDLRISPLIADSHEGLPRALVQIAGKDPLRDEGIVYEKVLRECGVETKLFIYPGVPHGFASFLPQLGAGRKWKQDLWDGLDWLLRRTSDIEGMQLIAREPAP